METNLGQDSDLPQPGVQRDSLGMGMLQERSRWLEPGDERWKVGCLSSVQDFQPLLQGLELRERPDHRPALTEIVHTHEAQEEVLPRHLLLLLLLVVLLLGLDIHDGHRQDVPELTVLPWMLRRLPGSIVVVMPTIHTPLRRRPRKEGRSGVEVAPL